jgi:DNA (cytosine-5)-methyltransferase 1
MSEISCLDLFSGCGGLSRGLSEAGLKVKWSNENDKHAANTYRSAHPGTHLFEEDVTTLFQRIVEKDEKTPRKGEVDLIAGGPPCQGFSGYNRYRSPDDERNSLVEVFLDYVEFLRPRYVLIENVPGMLSMEEGRVPKLILSTLEEFGYQTRLGILQAGYYGLPQSRWRVFIWAAVSGSVLPNFPEPTHMFSKTTIFGAKDFKNHIVKAPNDRADLFWRPESMVTVGDAISDLPPIENGGGADEMDYALEPKTDYQKRARDGAKKIYDHKCSRLGEKMYPRCVAIPKKPGAGWLDLPDHLKPRNLARHGDKRYDNRFGRLHWEGIFNTVLTKVEPYWGRVFHPTQDRVISIREVARAQGLPDNLRFSGPMAARYKQIGNAVPVPLARSLGLELMRVVENFK